MLGGMFLWVLPPEIHLLHLSNRPKLSTSEIVTHMWSLANFLDSQLCQMAFIVARSKVHKDGSKVRVVPAPVAAIDPSTLVFCNYREDILVRRYAVHINLVGTVFYRAVPGIAMGRKTRRLTERGRDGLEDVSVCSSAGDDERVRTVIVELVLGGRIEV